MNDEKFSKLMQQHEGVGATSLELSPFYQKTLKSEKRETFFKYVLALLASLGACVIWYFCGMKNTGLLSFAWLLVAYLIYQSVANEERNEKIEERLKDLRELIFNKDSFANDCKLKAKYQAVHYLIQKGEISLGMDCLAAGKALKDKYKAIIESFNLQLGIDELDAIGVPYDKEELFINHTDQPLGSKKKFPTCLELISQNGIFKNWKAYHMEPLELYQLVEGFYSRDEKKKG